MVYPSVTDSPGYSRTKGRKRVVVVVVVVVPAYSGSPGKKAIKRVMLLLLFCSLYIRLHHSGATDANAVDVIMFVSQSGGLMTRSSMSSMAMLPPTANSYYSGIQPNFGQPSSVSEVIFFIIFIEN